LPYYAHNKNSQCSADFNSVEKVSIKAKISAKNERKENSMFLYFIAICFETLEKLEK